MARNDLAFEQWASELIVCSSSPGVVEETNEDYAAWLAGLPADAKAVASGEVVQIPDPVPLELPKRYGIVECHDGEYPIFKMCGTPEIQAQQIAALEGKDVAVALFIGHIVRITQGPTRYILYPDGSALRVPRREDEEPEFCDAPPDIDIQEDGFLGPPEFSIIDGLSDDVKEEEDEDKD